MIKPDETYTVGVLEPNANTYPYGGAKNSSTGTTEDGFPIEKAWVNDINGFFQSLMFCAASEPNNLSDSLNNPQLVNALHNKKWNNTLTYEKGSIVTTSDGGIWRAKQATGRGTGSVAISPLADSVGTYWERVISETQLNSATQALNNKIDDLNTSITVPVEVGTIVELPHEDADDSFYLPADGRDVFIDSYPLLFEKIGDTYARTKPNRPTNSTSSQLFTLPRINKEIQRPTYLVRSGVYAGLIGDYKITKLDTVTFNNKRYLCGILAGAKRGLSSEDNVAIFDIADDGSVLIKTILNNTQFGNGVSDASFCVHENSLLLLVTYSNMHFMHVFDVTTFLAAPLDWSVVPKFTITDRYYNIRWTSGGIIFSLHDKLYCLFYGVKSGSGAVEEDKQYLTLYHITDPSQNTSFSRSLEVLHYGTEKVVKGLRFAANPDDDTQHAIILYNTDDSLVEPSIQVFDIEETFLGDRLRSTGSISNIYAHGDCSVTFANGGFLVASNSSDQVRLTTMRIPDNLNGRYNVPVPNGDLFTSGAMGHACAVMPLDDYTLQGFVGQESSGQKYIALEPYKLEIDPHQPFVEKKVYLRAK